MTGTNRTGMKSNAQVAPNIGRLSKIKELTVKYGFSVASGDLQRPGFAPQGLLPDGDSREFKNEQRLRQLGWTKATELVKVARRDAERLDCATRLHKATERSY